MIVSGETIRMLRTIKGMKQETMAKELGISQPAYCKLEQCDEINGKRLDKIISVFGYTKEELENVIKNSPPQGIHQLAQTSTNTYLPLCSAKTSSNRNLVFPSFINIDWEERRLPFVNAYRIGSHA